MRTIDQVLDRAQAVQKVKSDYKLGLCLGIGQSSISNYRLGKTLPDESVCLKLAQAMGEDPALLTVEMQAQRAKTPETKQIWISIAKRLQSGFANVQMLVLVAIVCIASLAIPALSAVYLTSLSVSQFVYYVKSQRYLIRAVCGWFVKLCKVERNVQSYTHPAAFLPA